MKINRTAFLLLIITMVLFIPSIFQFFVPSIYVDVYLSGIGRSYQALESADPDLANILTLGFQGIGFAVLGYHLLAWPILFFSVRKGEIWAILTFFIAQFSIWTINLYLEAMHGGILVVIYSAFVLLLLTISALLIKFKK